MIDLEERLRADASGPDPVPSLDDLLAQALPAHGSRVAARWLAVAASVLLVVAAATAVVVARTAEHRSAPAATGRTSEPPSALFFGGGVEYRYVTSQTYSDGVLNPDDQSQIFVWASTQEVACISIPVARVVRQDDRVVVLAVDAYVAADEPTSGLSCTADKLKPVRLTAHLGRSLNGRRVVTPNGTTVPVLVASRLPRSDSPPPGFAGAQLVVDGDLPFPPAPAVAAVSVSRTFTDGHGSRITVSAGTTDLAGRPLKTLSQPTINGHRGLAYQWTGFTEDVAVRWNQPGIGPVTVTQSGGHRPGDGALTLTALIAYARTLR